jgi:hypothetical protein
MNALACAVLCVMMWMWMWMWLEDEDLGGSSLRRVAGWTSMQMRDFYFWHQRQGSRAAFEADEMAGRLWRSRAGGPGLRRPGLAPFPLQLVFLVWLLFFLLSLVVLALE